MKSQVGFIEDKQYHNIKEGFLALKELGIVYANHRIISKSSHIKNVEIFSHKDWGMEYVENEYEDIDPIELGIKNTKNSIFDWSWLPMNKIHIHVMKIRKEKYGINSGITCVLEKDHHLFSVSLAHSSQEGFLKKICTEKNFLIKNYIDNIHSALLHHAYSI